MIKLRLIKQVALDSLAVRFWTESPWSHVEFCVPGGFLSARPDGGVKVRKVDYCHPHRIAIGTVDCNEKVTQGVLDFAYGQIGKGYDWLAIIAFVFHTHWSQKNTWDCSQLIDASFLSADYPVINQDTKPPVVTPGLLYASTRICWKEVDIKADPFGWKAQEAA